MKLNNLCIGRVYNVKSNEGCAILTADGYTLANVPAGGYRIFVAPVTEATVLGDAEVSLDPKGRAAVVGELVGVRQIAGLPVGYEPVEYLESVSRSFIDAKVSREPSVGVRVSFAFTKDDTNFNFVFRTTTADNINYIGIYSSSDQPPARIRRWGIYNIPIPTYKEKTEVTINYKNSSIVTLNEDVKTSNPSYVNMGTGGTIGFFSKHATATGSEIDQSFARIYSAEVTVGEEVVRRLIPVTDSNGAPCMFDTVTRLPFYNSGEGDFLYPGSESSAYSLRRQFPDWGKLTERGLKRLYHVPEGYTGDPYDYAIEHGFKHIVETEKPSEGYWTPRWTETDDEIVLVWDEAEPPVEDIPVESEQEPVQ